MHRRLSPLLDGDWWRRYNCSTLLLAVRFAERSVCDYLRRRLSSLFQYVSFRDNSKRDEIIRLRVSWGAKKFRLRRIADFTSLAVVRIYQVRACMCTQVVFTRCKNVCYKPCNRHHTPAFVGCTYILDKSPGRLKCTKTLLKSNQYWTHGTIGRQKAVEASTEIQAEKKCNAHFRALPTIRV